MKNLLSPFSMLLLLGMLFSNPINALDDGQTSNNCHLNNPPSCSVPIDIHSVVLSGNAVRINWTAAIDATKYRVRYRTIGGSWTEVQTGGIETSRFLNVLTASTDYEYQVKTNCTALNSVWSSTYVFTTLGDICDYPDFSAVDNITAITARIRWFTDVDDIKYKVKYKAKVPGAIWYTETFNTNILNVGNLVPNTSYKYKLKTQCAASWTNWSPNYEFTTAASLDEGINQRQRSENLQVFPNPAKDILNIVLPTEEVNQLFIQNINGQIVKTLRTDNSQSQINIADLSAGMYYIKVITTDQQSTVKKFIKTN